MKTNTDVKAGLIVGGFVFITNIASNHNGTLQLGLVNLNETIQQAQA